MHNPTDTELDALQQAAIARGEDAMAAFNEYVTALCNRDEAVDELGIEGAAPDPARLESLEAQLSAARQELDHQLGRMVI